MIDLIKKTFLAGIGAAAVTKDKFQGVLDEFVREGRISAQDARRMAEKVAAEGRREFHDACAELSGRLRDMAESGDSRPRNRRAGRTRPRARTRRAAASRRSTAK